MASPRFAPAGLLLEYADSRVAIDGGAFAPAGLDAWLVTDGHSELMAQIRRLCRPLALTPAAASFRRGDFHIRPRPVVHTSHDAYGYQVFVPQGRIVWAPEFFRFPKWAAQADLMFAEAAAFSRPIHFAGHVGGHLGALDVCRTAQRLGVRRLVLAHIGRPTLRAIDAGWKPGFGELGADGTTYVLGKSARVSRRVRKRPLGTVLKREMLKNARPGHDKP